MTDIEKLTMLRVMVGESDDRNNAAMMAYLNIAKTKILSRAFPFDNTQTEVPTRYAYLQCEIAAYLWNKRGAEGQLSHSENGISRSYESADIPESMMREIIPSCGVIGGSV